MDRTTGKKTLAVIPAAGAGTRLGQPIPKTLVPVSGERRVIDVILGELAPLVDQIAVIVSPDFEDFIEEPLVSGETLPRLCVQQSPTGMCDALRCSDDMWADVDRILVVWGDQVNLSNQTLSRALAQHAFRDQCAVIPTALIDDPYVQYDFDQSRLVAVRQSRDGDQCDKQGLTDVGVFVISTPGLHDLIGAFAESTPRSAATGELNLLPLFPFLQNHGWSVESSLVADPTEACGINTAAELDSARMRLEAMQ